MRTSLFRLLFASLLLAMPCGLQAQVCDMLVDSVTNFEAPNKLIAGNTHRFYLTAYFYCTALASDYNLSQSFLLYSPDGASISSIIASFQPAYPPGLFMSNINHWHKVGGTGSWVANFSPPVSIGATDSLGIVMIGTGFGGGLKPNQTTPMWYIDFATDIADAGRHICIDSTYEPPSGGWEWVQQSGGSHTIYPEWNTGTGEICYELVGPSPVTFTEVTAAAGLPVGDQYGHSWMDHDGDDNLDCFFARFDLGDVYENDGSANFSSVASGLTLGDPGSSIGAAWADFNNDGSIDLAVADAVSNAEKVYRNDGGGSFTDITVAAGLSGMLGYVVTWVDYDNDGWADLFCGESGGDPYGECKLFRNNGDESFTDVTIEAGLDGDRYISRAGFFDFNNDQFPDLLISIGSNAGSYLYENNRDGTFTDRTSWLESGIGVYGFAFGDYNRDGWMDIALNYDDGVNFGVRLYSNDGGTGFTQDQEWNDEGIPSLMFVSMVDFDNNGRLDVLQEYRGENHLWLQDLATPTFTDYASGAGIADYWVYYGAVLGDMDNDGDLDMLVGTDVALYRNELLPGAPDAHWIGFRLEGRSSNRSALGARVYVFDGTNGQQMSEVCAGDGLGQSQLWRHFGLGAATAADSVVVRWPSGTRSRIIGPAIDQYHNIVEGLIATMFTSFELDSAEVVSVETADLDLDTYTDIVYVGETAVGLFVNWGQFGDPPLGGTDSLLAVTNADLELFHVNTDTLVDIVAATNSWIYVLLNNGDRTFDIDSTANTTAFAFAPDKLAPEYGGFPQIAAGFIDGDGYADLVVTPDSWFAGDGSGSLFANTPLGFSFESIDIADLNADGWDDLVLIEGDSMVGYASSGSPDFLFSKVNAVYLGLETYDLSSITSNIDVNLDGLVDVVAVVAENSGSDDTSVVTIATSDEAGNLTAFDVITIAGTAPEVSLSDIDRDNYLDLIVSNAGTGNLEIYYNLAGIQFEEGNIIPVGQASDLMFALASADLDRDGQPDFVSGSAAGDNMMLLLNNEPDLPVLADEMFVTGYDRLDISITNPLGFAISRNLQTVAGSDYYRMHANDNNIFDVRTYDFNLLIGEYRLEGIPDPTAIPPREPITLGIGIDGSQLVFAANNYDWPPELKSYEESSTESFIFYYDVEVASAIYPENGLPTADQQPTFDWSALVPGDPPGVEYRFQLNEYHDFISSPSIHDVGGLVNPQFMPGVLLDADSLYYWRYLTSPDGGTTYPDTSRAFAAFILYAGCCFDRVGDANGVGGDEPTIGDISVMIDAKFITGTCEGVVDCFTECDINQSGGLDATCDDITIGDISTLIDYLFITGPTLGLPDCL